MLLLIIVCIAKYTMHLYNVQCTSANLSSAFGAFVSVQSSRLSRTLILRLNSVHQGISSFAAFIFNVLLCMVWLMVDTCWEHSRPVLTSVSDVSLHFNNV